MAPHRAQRIEALRRKKRTDVLVVGGGINGISTWRELTLNGVDAVLVERGDFMSGASSAPSRMIHGGLRYMENGEFTLVRQSLRERNLLLRNAPHLVSPLPTLVPLASHWAGIWSAALRFVGLDVAPGDRGAVIVKLGLSLYDAYAGGGSSLPRHRFFGRRETRRRWPALPDHLVGVALYHDAKISHPERLGVEMVLECEAGENALALNHVGMTALEDQGAILEDRLTGERIGLDAEIIVNATGAWIDLTNSVMTPNPPRLIGGTKGSHLVIDNEELRRALGDAMVYFANREGRVCILFAHLGKVLAGSTDISVDNPDEARCDDQEVEYILASMREVFPDIAVTPDQIVYRFAGVRPLPRAGGKVNANISRDHSCEWLPAPAAASRPVLNLIGGKWTTFRAFGADAADTVLAKLGRSRNVDTSARQIGGGRGFPAGAARAAWLSGFAVDADLASALLDRYGTRAAELIARLGPNPRRLSTLPGHSREEIGWLVETEHVATLADLVLRRMTVALSGDLSLAVIDELAGIAAEKLGWSPAETKRQRLDLLEHLERFHGLPEATLRGRNADRKDDDVQFEESTDEPAVRERQVS